MKRIVRGLLLAFVVTANGCGGECTTILIHGIVVTIVVDATGNRFEEDVTVIATEGSS